MRMFRVEIVRKSLTYNLNMAFGRDVLKLHYQVFFPSPLQNLVSKNPYILTSLGTLWGDANPRDGRTSEVLQKATEAP